PLRHEQYSSKIRRDARNPLFKINHTNAEHRYHLAPLGRRVWSHAKTEDSLRRTLGMYRLYRNFTRWITNRKRVTPAMRLGITDTRKLPLGILRWRRTFGVEQLRALGAIAA